MKNVDIRKKPRMGMGLLAILAIVAFSLGLITVKILYQDYDKDVEKALYETKEALNLTIEAMQYQHDDEFSKAAIRYYDAQSHFEMAEVYSKAAIESAPIVEDTEIYKNHGMYCYYMSKMCFSYGEMCEELAKPQPNRDLADKKFNEGKYYYEKASEYSKEQEYAI